MPRLRSSSLLISQPFLGDPNFERSVVLLCRHDEEDGSFGLVLNRASNLNLSDVLQLPVPDDSPVGRMPLLIGGPVQPDTLHYLHQRPDIPEAIALGQDVYWGGDFQVLLAYCSAASWLRRPCASTLATPAGRPGNWPRKSGRMFGSCIRMLPGKSLLWTMMPSGRLSYEKRGGVSGRYPIIPSIRA